MIRKKIQKIIDNVDKFTYRGDKELKFENKEKEQGFHIYLDYGKFLAGLRVIHRGNEGDYNWRQVNLNLEEEYILFDVCHKIISKKIRENDIKIRTGEEEIKIEREERINKTIDYCLNHSDFNIKKENTNE